MLKAVEEYQLGTEFYGKNGENMRPRYMKKTPFGVERPKYKRSAVRAWKGNVTNWRGDQCATWCCNTHVTEEMDASGSLSCYQCQFRAKFWAHEEYPGKYLVHVFEGDFKHSEGYTEGFLERWRRKVARQLVRDHPNHTASELADEVRYYAGLPDDELQLTKRYLQSARGRARRGENETQKAMHFTAEEHVIKETLIDAIRDVKAGVRNWNSVSSCSFPVSPIDFPIWSRSML